MMQISTPKIIMVHRQIQRHPKKQTLNLKVELRFLFLAAKIIPKLPSVISVQPQFL